MWKDDEVYALDLGECLHDCLQALYELFEGRLTLYIIDNMTASKALKKMKDVLSDLAFPGLHAKQSVWVLAQRYNAVLKDLREQTQWVALFHCKERDSFDECLRENDIIPAAERPVVREHLTKRKHAKLVLNTSQPSCYTLFPRKACILLLLEAQ